MLMLFSRTDVGVCTTMLKIFTISTAFLGALAVLVYFLAMSGGKPIGTDLSVVGQGRPVLVLAYENFSPTGGDALNRLRKVRSDYDSKLDFVVADMGTPTGQAFANRYRLVDGQAVFLKPNGEPLQVTFIAVDEKELRSRLDSKLAAVE
ncbi:MAG: hypothetical protein ACI9WC_000242 [Arenicella sp.]|jgi:hypothetical protein